MTFHCPLLLSLTAVCGVAHAADCTSLIGDWNWFLGGTVTVNEDHTLRYDGREAGRWRCLDPRNDKAELTWNVGSVDTITVTGGHLSGINQQGVNITAERRRAPAIQAPQRPAGPAPASPPAVSGDALRPASLPAPADVRPPSAASVGGHDGHGRPAVYPEQTSVSIPAGLDAQKIFDLASQWNQRGRSAEAAAAFLKCSDLGNMRCTSALGIMYDAGRGVPLDRIRAIWYLRRAADAGNRGAAYMIGVYWEDGEVLPQDMKKAMDWYMKSAQLGLYEAERRVGLAYEFGDVVPRSRPQAIAWLSKAAAQGDGISAEILGVLRNPRSPARFRDLDEFAAYYQSLYSAKFTMGGHPGGYNGDAYAHRNAVAAYEAAGNPAGAATCQATPSCRH